MKRGDTSKRGTRGRGEIFREALGSPERGFFALGDVTRGEGVGDKDTTIVAENGVFFRREGLVAFGVVFDDSFEEFGATLDHVFF